MKKRNKLKTGFLIWLAAMGALSGCSKNLPEPKDLSIQAEPALVVPPAPAVALETSVRSMSEIYRSMQQVTGVIPSANTTNIYNNNKTNYSPKGRAYEINSSMFQAIVVLAGSFCDDLYMKERALPSSARNFYRDINFTAATVPLNLGGGPSVLRDDIVRRLNLGLVGRLPADDPATPVQDDYRTYAQSLVFANLGANDLNQNDTRTALLMLCTSTLARFAAQAR